MLGRHRRVAEAAVVGRRVLRGVHHLPLGGNEGRAHRINGSAAIEPLIMSVKRKTIVHCLQKTQGFVSLSVCFHTRWRSRKENIKDTITCQCRGSTV